MCRCQYVGVTGSGGGGRGQTRAPLPNFASARSHPAPHSFPRTRQALPSSPTVQDLIIETGTDAPRIQ